MAFARKAREWTRLITTVGAGQVAVQAIGLVSGIFVIRALPTHEYALYTLANTMLGTMTILADGGIASGVMAQGGRIWQDRQKLGAVLATGLDLRKKFAVFSLLVATPILFYLLRHHGASWLMSTLIVLSLIPAFFTALSGTLLGIPPALHQDVVPIQKINVVSNAGRLVLLTLTTFAFPFAAVAILCAGTSQVWANWRVRLLSPRYVDLSPAPDLAVRREILSVVRRIMPGSIYYCISGQITIWLLSLFGTTIAVAQVGALGRLAIPISMLGTIFATLMVPRFARLPEVHRLLLARYFQLQAGLLAACAGITAAAFVFSSHLLWVLGPNYRGLDAQFLLMIAASCVGIMAGAAFSLNSSRGIVAPPLLTIPYSIATQIAFILLFDVSTLTGVLLVQLTVGLAQLLMHASYLGLAFKR